MTLTIPTRAAMEAGCDDGAIIARLRLAGVPMPLWYAAFDSDPTCSAVRGFTLGTYASDARFATEDKAEWARFTRDDARTAIAEKRGTYIQGCNRIGKSHLAAAQVRASDTDCFWISEADFAAFVYASKAGNDAPTIADLIRYITTPVTHGWRRGKIERVIYDDAAARMEYGGKGVYWVGELFLLIDTLMNAGIALTVTSNADADALCADTDAGGFGPRVGKRILEMTGDPLLLFAPEKKPQSGPPVKKIDRCTCTAHATALPPEQNAPYLEYTLMGKKELRSPPTARNLFPTYPELWDRNLDTWRPPNGVEPPATVNVRTKWAEIGATHRTARSFAPVRGDEPEPRAPGERAPDGKFCWRYGAACRFSREWGDAERDAIHANFYHHLTPKTIEQVQEPQPETQES